MSLTKPLILTASSWSPRVTELTASRESSSAKTVTANRYSSMVMWKASRSFKLTGTVDHDRQPQISCATAFGEETTRTLKKLSNFLECQQPAQPALGYQAAPQPDVEENSQCCVLNDACPLCVIPEVVKSVLIRSCGLVSQNSRQKCGRTCSKGAWMQHRSRPRCRRPRT